MLSTGIGLVVEDAEVVVDDVVISTEVAAKDEDKIDVNVSGTELLATGGFVVDELVAASRRTMTVVAVSASGDFDVVTDIMRLILCVDQDVL